MRVSVTVIGTPATALPCRIDGDDVDARAGRGVGEVVRSAQADVPGRRVDDDATRDWRCAGARRLRRRLRTCSDERSRRRASTATSTVSLPVASSAAGVAGDAIVAAVAGVLRVVPEGVLRFAGNFSRIAAGIDVRVHARATSARAGAPWRRRTGTARRPRRAAARRRPAARRVSVASTRKSACDRRRRETSR